MLDTPISEQAIVGTAIGAAVQGLRPLAEIMFADFAGVCFDQIANQLAKYRYMTGGQVRLPVTIRLANGAGTGFAAQHSQPVENWFLNVPGLKLVTPATPADAYALLRAAIRDPDPVLVFEHKGLLNVKGPLSDRPGELGRAEVVRRGDAVTVVATQLMRHRALEAAAVLAEEGIEVELIDPRTLVPFDFETVRRSVERTNRIVVVQEASFAGSWGATLAARLTIEAFEALDAPPAVVGGDDTPIPYAGVLEDAWLPDVAPHRRRDPPYGGVLNDLRRVHEPPRGSLARDLPQDHAPRRRRLGVRSRRRRRGAHARPHVAARAGARVPHGLAQPGVRARTVRRLGAGVPQRRRRRVRGAVPDGGADRSRGLLRRAGRARRVAERALLRGVLRLGARRRPRRSGRALRRTAPAATTRRSCACSPTASATWDPTRAASPSGRCRPGRRSPASRATRPAGRSGTGTAGLYSVLGKETL